MTYPERVTLALARSRLHYDAKTGLFTCLKTGELRGTVNTTGHVHITVGRIRVLAHRLAWWMHFGEEPAGFIDHINRDRADNRIANLRLATRAQNGQNCMRSPLSGLKGAHWDKRRGNWNSKIKVSGKTIHLGTFDDAMSAARAYAVASERLFGEFARHSFLGQEK